MGSVHLLFNCPGFARAARGSLRLALALALFVLPPTAAVAQDVRLPEVLAARVTTTPERGRLVLDLSASTAYAIASLDDPERIAVDVKAANVAITTPQAVSGSGIIASFTTTMAEDGRARAELTLSKPAIVQQAYVLDP